MVNIDFLKKIKLLKLFNRTTDQLVSFVVPLKDLEYTICFYVNDFTNPAEIKEKCILICYNSENKIIVCLYLIN